MIKFMFCIVFCFQMELQKPDKERECKTSFLFIVKGDAATKQNKKKKT